MSNLHLEHQIREIATRASPLQASSLQPAMIKGRGRALVIAPQVDTATTEALRHMARTKQRRTYLPYTYLPSRSRYSFTDAERMEG